MRSRAATIVLAGILALAPAGGAVGGPGVSRRAIKLGFHVPMTGANPLSSDSAQKGVAVYWRWLRRQNRPINGRHVSTVIRNDNYNPSQAVAVCKELVEKEHVFMLAGVIQGSGVNQMQACARYAESVGVPYVSLGMTKIGLKGLQRYFAISTTWPREAQLLADLLVGKKGARREKNGIVSMDTPNFADARDAFIRRMENRRGDIHYNRAVPKTAGSEHAQTVVAEMKARGIENVFMLATPIWFLQVLQAARNQNFRPLWTGISTIATSGDSIASIGCRNGTLGRSRFISPLPAYGDRDKFDPRHDRAMQAIYDEDGDFITWMGWAGSKAIAKMIDGVGRRLTRKRFARVTERDKRFRTHVLPPFGFTPNDHFGGKRARVLKADCRTNRWKTIRRVGP